MENSAIAVGGRFGGGSSSGEGAGALKDGALTLTLHPHSLALIELAK